jgi:hypothetical protein
MRTPDQQSKPHEHGASPSHEEGAWCSYGKPAGCGLFLPLSAFTQGYAPPYYADVRGLIQVNSNVVAPWQDEMRQEVYRAMSAVFTERRNQREFIETVRAALAKVVLP